MILRYIKMSLKSLPYFTSIHCAIDDVSLDKVLCTSQAKSSPKEQCLLRSE